MAILKTTEQFVIKAKKIHGDSYNYDNTDYKGAKVKIVITCSIHGKFEQVPSNHLSGKGCPKCSQQRIANLKRSNTEEFVLKANVIHNNKFMYNDINYINNSTKITITCLQHGDFTQSPQKHLKGRGCPECACENRISFKSTDFIKKYLNATFYIVRLFNDSESFIKIGITGRYIKNRMMSIPYKYETLHKLNTKSEDVVYLEKYVKRILKNFKYSTNINFRGYTECYTQEALPEIRNYLFNF